MLKIVGAKGNIHNVDNFLKKLVNFARSYNLVIQAFNADMIYGKNHLISAVNHAVRAMERKTNTTNTIDKEILLYASGERQLKIAIPKMGVKKGRANIAVVLIGDKISYSKVNDFLKNLSLIKDNKVLEGNIKTLKKFGISDNEINTVMNDKYENLILEKVALVDIIK